MASIISAGTTSGTSLNLSGDTSGVLQLASNGSTTAVTINTSQNVGIGTASPTEKLSVAGAITATGLVSTTGSILSGGYVAGAGYYRSSGMVNETVTVTTAATVYGINKDSGAGGSSSTSTYDITGVPNQDGAFLFLYVRCSNTAGGINTVVIVTVHGSAELFRNSVQNTTKTGSVMLARQNGSWYVVAPYHTGAAISI